MSENNDGGLAERGGTSNVSGTGSNFGGSGGPTGSGGSNSANLGRNMGGPPQSQNSVGTNRNSSTVNGLRNFTSVRPLGELLPGVRAPVVPGFGFAPRRDQTLGDIQEQNRIGNMNAMGQNMGQSNGSAGSVSNPQRRRTVYDPVTRRYVPIPQPKPPRIDPITGRVLPQNFGFSNPYTDYTHPPSSTFNPNWPNVVDPTLPTHYPTQGIYDPSFGGGLAGTGGVSPVESGNSLGPSVEGNFGDLGGIMGSDGSGPYHDPRGGSISGGPPNQAGRQFGGPVAPGQQYTVGENGPETLQMNAMGGGQVIPHNPMDRLGSMSPQMMQQQFQLMKQQHLQQKMQQRPGGQPPVGQPQQPVAQPPSPPTMPPTPQPPQAGGWQNRMGIEGLSRPMRPPPGGAGGFGLSGLGQPGVMGQLRRQGGFGGQGGFGS